MKYAYVTFRSMLDVETILLEYNISSSYRFLVNYLCCCCMRKEQERLAEKSFYGNFLTVTKACEPEAIKWENLGVSKNSRNFRKCCVWVIAFIVILACLIGTV